MRFLSLLTCLVLTTGPLCAAPPAVTHLFPAGVQQGQSAEITIGGVAGTAPFGVWTDRSDLKIEVPPKGSTFKVTASPNAIPGRCWIRVHNAEGASTLKPFIIGTVPELREKEPNDKLSQAQPVSSPTVVVNGVFAKSGDADLFAVSLKAGQTLVAALDGNTLLGSPLDGLLQIVSPQGFTLEQNDDAHGMDPLLIFRAPKDGRYFVRTFAFPAAPNSSIRLAGGASYVYRLTLTTGPFIDHVTPAAVTRGVKTNVQLSGWNIPDGLRQRAVQSNGASDVTTVFGAEFANAIVVPVVDGANVTEKEAVLRKSPWDPSVTISGRIESAGEVDAYAFSLKKGTTVDFRIASRSLGEELDPTLEVFDAKGKSLKKVDDSTRNVFDPVLLYKVPADGVYRVEISDLHRRGGLRYAYRLSARIPSPDFKLSVAAASFTLAAAKPLEIPVTVSRVAGFAEEIEIRVDGLPAGVTSEVVKSAAKGATAKTVKLVLKSKDGKAFSGPLKIRGKSTGDLKRSHLATAAIATPKARTPHLWLTATAGKPAAKKPAKTP